jgi:hypothetical protein
MQLDWEDPRLGFVVREPFASRSSRAVDAGAVATIGAAAQRTRLVVA